MRILLVNKYWQFVGGVERHLGDVADLFTQLGHEVVPFAMRQAYSPPDDAHLNRYFPSQTTFRAANAREAGRGLARSMWSYGSIGPLRSLLSDTPVDCAYVLHTYHQLGTRLL